MDKDQTVTEKKMTFAYHFFIIVKEIGVLSLKIHYCTLYPQIKIQRHTLGLN